MSRVITALLLLALSVPLAADEKKKPKDDVSKIGERDVGKGMNFYSLEDEMAMGKQLAGEIERQARVVKDPLVAEYVNRLGQNLARHSDSKLPFTFKVIEDRAINAFALPGGYCFVNTGLLLEAETEAEVAGVLAHEIAHVAARHGTRQASRGRVASLAMIPLVIATGGWAGYGIQQAANVAIPMVFLEFSRGFEREADHLGLQYLYAAGYDPTAFVDFFEKLGAKEKTKPGSLAGVFRSHPMTDDRITAAQAEMQEILPSKPEYLVTTSEFLNIQKRLGGQLVARERGETSDRPTVRQKGTVIKADEPLPEETEKEDERPTIRRKQ